MARLLFVLGLALVLFLLVRWFLRQPPRAFWQAVVIALAVVLLLLVITGRAHWLTAVFAAILPFVRAMVLFVLNNLPLLKRLLASIGPAHSASQPRGGQTSTVEGKYLRMTLAHDSGELDGEVIFGQFSGCLLSDMGLEELLQLLNECEDDDDSVALLHSYLDRVHGNEWRESNHQHRQETGSLSGEMSRQEAFQVLGLSPDAGEQEIIEAHRRLMQKLHPDRGGSAYLAARINLAKKVLLEG